MGQICITALTHSGWELDYARFRTWLSDKYGVGRAYLFIGLISKQKDLSARLQEAGFTLVFKDVIFDGRGQAKGNCDADLITPAMWDSYEGAAVRAVLVTSDGGACTSLSEVFSSRRNSSKQFCPPAPASKCSVLLKRTGAKIAYIDDQRSLLEAQK